MLMCSINLIHSDLSAKLGPLNYDQDCGDSHYENDLRATDVRQPGGKHQLLDTLLHRHRLLICEILDRDSNKGRGLAASAQPLPVRLSEPSYQDAREDAP
ncbi:hypothetical protein NDU88_005079 [Pleurodeles waltl]|uniref:Uncharacterized protein n=1 Tax=Pleurodeles waltl TaxID=8319 RepID=A0AAV7WZP0_PLEWA|nr:hypothetical protein NDU88_005079 [Pleurodeles waltl]